MSEPLRVLFVDDSEKDVFLLLRQLKKNGFEPQHKRVDDAATLRAALQSEDWQIVISDFHMPNFDGLAALQVFKEVGRDIPFILVSATVGEETAVLAMKRGAHDYVMKSNLTRLAPVVQQETPGSRYPPGTTAGPIGITTKRRPITAGTKNGSNGSFGCRRCP